MGTDRSTGSRRICTNIHGRIPYITYEGRRNMTEQKGAVITYSGSNIGAWYM
jgi:hypothetical protein